VPFVFIQLLMVGLVIAFPQMVMHYKGPVVDPGEVEIILPPFGGDQPGFGLPGLNAPPAMDGASQPAQQPAPGTDLSQPPSFGDAPAQQPAAPPATDLSQPPSFGQPPAAQPDPAPAPDLGQPPSFQ
jgi:hypothetical protein